MSDISIEIGDESGHLAELADWYNLISDLVGGGCECRLRAEPGPSAKGPEVLVELAVLAPVAKTVVNALVKYYQAKRNARIVLTKGDRKLNVSGLTPDEAKPILEKFMSEDGRA